MPECFKYSIAPLLLETAVQIALGYLARAGEIDNYAETRQFLVERIEFMIRQGQHNKLVLANRAISAFEKDRSARTIDLTLAS